MTQETANEMMQFGEIEVVRNVTLPLAIAIISVLFTLGCRAQVPPASNGYKVVLTATAPLPSGNWLGCVTGQPTCTYAVYAETIASGTSCDSTTSTNYKEITNPASRPTSPSFTDANTTGLTRCYDMETVQGTENSAPSNVAGPIISPGVPLAPTLAVPVPQSAEVVKPILQPETTPLLLSKLSAPMNLQIKVVR